MYQFGMYLMRYICALVDTIFFVPLVILWFLLLYCHGYGAASLNVLNTLRCCTKQCQTRKGSLMTKRRNLMLSLPSLPNALEVRYISTTTIILQNEIDSCNSFNLFITFLTTIMQVLRCDDARKKGLLKTKLPEPRHPMFRNKKPAKVVEPRTAF